MTYIPANNVGTMNTISYSCRKSECYQEGSKWVCECIRDPITFKEILIIILVVFICLSPIIYLFLKEIYEW